jgi:hypothetical protein
MDDELLEEISELEEVDYKTPDDLVWEDKMTESLNTVIRYVKEMAEKRK